MKKSRFLIVFAVILAMLLFALTASAETLTGWQDNGDGTKSYYYSNGEKAVNTEYWEDGYYYYFDENGIMLENQWFEANVNDTYYYGENGIRYVRGVYEIDGELYAFNDYGALYLDGPVDQLYDEELGVYPLYFANPDGSLLRNEWKVAYAIYDYDDMYYFGEDGRAVGGGIHNIEGKNYLFEPSGQLVVNRFYETYDYDAEEWFYYLTDSNGAIITNAWRRPHLDNGDDSWYYFGADGKAYVDRIEKIGANYYAFDYNGTLIYDQVITFNNDETGWWDTYYAYGLDKDGALATNLWIQPYLEYEDTDWFYLGSDGKAYTDGVYKIGSAYYGFRVDGRMYEDTLFSFGHYDDTLDMYIVDAAYKARPNGKLYVNQWYLDSEFDEWYYFGAEGKAPIGIATIGGKEYCFSEEGRMLEDCVTTLYIQGVPKHYIVDNDGHPTAAKNNAWTSANGAWYYVLDNEFCYHGVYTIGGKEYGFDWDHQMYADCFFDIDSYDEETDSWDYKNFYAYPSGILAKNAWVENYNQSTWYYFGADCAAYQDGLTQIGPYYYYFTEYGAYESTVLSIGNDVYSIDDNCRATLVTGWFDCPYSDSMMYADESGLLTDGAYEIDGKTYAFDYEGLLLTDEIYRVYGEEATDYYLIGQDGAFVTKYGWHKLGGNHLFVTEEGKLLVGWYKDYYMTPYMTYCSYFESDGKLYTSNINGVSKQVTVNGFYTIPNFGTVYLKNGSIVKEKWEKINAEWYYFDENGIRISDTIYPVDEVTYYFDQEGKMWDSGWHRVSGTSYWVYANKNGTLYTGKDSAGYVFNDYGVLVPSSLNPVGETWYVTDANGKALAALKEGWNKVNGNWYFVEEGMPLTDRSYTDAAGKIYFFDSDGVMLSNRMYEGRFLAEDGHVLTKWIKKNGNWYYADPENDGYLCGEGIYYIDDVEYLFKDYVLQTNKTLTYYGTVYTTNADGVVISWTDANGWGYYIDGSQAVVTYHKNGKSYTGWVGDYYIDYGRLQTDTIVNDKGKYYYVKPNGLCARNGWYQLWDEWIYAKKDGSLYYNEWATIGGKKYYFVGTDMAYGGVYEIDGKSYEFADNGVLIGEYKYNLSNIKDGWYEFEGNWYFFMAGEPVTSRHLYIGNKWYYFDWYGIMASNTFAHSIDIYGTTYFYYYTADGSRANYKGWKVVNGEWCYFNENSSASVGWILDRGKYYYQDYSYDDEGYSLNVAMVTGTVVIDGILHRFDNGGVYLGMLTTNGWHYANGGWYYVENGKIVYGERTIKGVDYAFGYDGKMIANEVFEGKFYDADGKCVTTKGWRYVGSDWIYIAENGRVIEHGIALIDGKEYAFKNHVWVK